jgi:glycolate oxidase iron-sulfur subunit
VGLSKMPEEYSATVTYHDACHLVHTQKVSRQPRELLQNIPGIKLIELSESSWCCGSAGIYNVVRYEDSMKILDRKMENIKSTGAEIVTTANPGCHLQLEYGIEKKGLKMEVLHPVSILSRAYAETLDR